MEIWAVGITRNETDIIRLSVQNLLQQGIDRVLILDNGSTDGTAEILDELSRSGALEWRPYTGPFVQSDLTTALVREAFVRGADWVLPFDADEFWYAPDSTMRAILEVSRAGALEVQVVNFVQRREQVTATPDALLTMTRRTPVAVGPIDQNPGFVEQKLIAYVEMLYPAKWIARTCPTLEAGWGNHYLFGAAKPQQKTDAILCLHAPLRSRSVLEQKTDGGRPADDLEEYLKQAWHIRRWRQIAEQGQLDLEWAANSYQQDALNLYGEPRPLIVDTRLRELVAPLIEPTGADGPGTVATSKLPAFAPVMRFPTCVRAWGVMAVRDARDLIRANILHHLSLGLEKVLVADDDSTDGTSDILDMLGSDRRVEVRRVRPPSSRGSLLTEMAREAFARGATWVLPIDEHGFWSVRGHLIDILADSGAGALGANVVTFVQSRAQVAISPDALLRMTMRVVEPAGPWVDACYLATSRNAPYVALAQPVRWICRATPHLVLANNATSASGIPGPVNSTAAIELLFAPLRARSVLRALADDARRLVNRASAEDLTWEMSHWLKVGANDLDREWQLNSYSLSGLGQDPNTYAICQDTRLRELVEPWLVSAGPQVVQRDVDRRAIDTRSATTAASVAVLPVSETALRDRLLPIMRKIDGWLGDDEAGGLMRAALKALSRFGTTAAIVEIGSYCGKSTAVLAGTIAASGVKTIIHAVDPHTGEVGAVDTAQGITRKLPTFERFSQNLVSAGLDSYVAPIRQHSYEVAWASPIGLLFVDGLHDYASVAEDGRHFLDWVLDGGLVVFHDYSDLFPGVERYVGELVASGVFRRLEHSDTLVVLERIGRLARPDRHYGNKVPSLLSETREPGLSNAERYREYASAQEFVRGNQVLEIQRQAALIQSLRERLEQHRHILSLSHPDRPDETRRREQIIDALARELRLKRQGLLPRHSDAGLHALRRRTVAMMRGTARRIGARHVRFGFRFTVGAARRAVVAFRAGRLELAPRRWVSQLRNYRRELSPGLPVPRAGPRFRVAERPTTGTRPDSARFLVISDSVPAPDRDAGSLRLFEMLKLLRQLGYAVTLMSHSEERRPREAEKLGREGVDVLYGARQALSHLSKEGASYSFVLLSRPDVAFRYLFAVRAYAIHARVAYDTVDLHWLRLSRAATVTGDAMLAAQGEEYRRIERFCVRSADLVIAVTDVERELLHAENPEARIEVIPTIHPPAGVAPNWQNRSGLMFVGSFGHAPNVDGVIYFCREVLPLVLQVLPETVVHVIGSYMPDNVRALNSDAVRILGWIEDLTPYFDRCRVFVSPLRYGSGMKGKITQSMAHGLPVVTTTIGAEGMMLRDGETALIADGPGPFARAIADLYENEELWTRMSARSAAHIAEHYSESAARARLVRVFPREALQTYETAGKEEVAVP